jgi:hypothetical protein
MSSEKVFIEHRGMLSDFSLRCSSPEDMSSPVPNCNSRPGDAAEDVTRALCSAFICFVLRRACEPRFQRSCRERVGVQHILGGIFYGRSMSAVWALSTPLDGKLHSMMRQSNIQLEV